MPLSRLVRVELRTTFVTGEYGQRTGLISFTLAPHRGRVIGATAVVAVAVGVLSMLLAFALGAVGNVVGSAVNGVDASWDTGLVDLMLVLLAQVLGLLVGFLLGVQLRDGPGRLPRARVRPAGCALDILATTQGWFADVRPWVDVGFAQGRLFDAPASAAERANLGVSGLLWFVLPLVVGRWVVLRSEVKEEGAHTVRGAVRGRRAGGHRGAGVCRVTHDPSCAVVLR